MFSILKKMVASWAKTVEDVERHGRLWALEQRVVHKRPIAQIARMARGRSEVFRRGVAETLQREIRLAALEGREAN